MIRTVGYQILKTNGGRGCVGTIRRGLGVIEMLDVEKTVAEGEICGCQRFQRRRPQDTQHEISGDM